MVRNTIWGTSVLHSWSIIIQCIYVAFLCSYPKMVLLITLMIITHAQQVIESTTFDLEQASDILLMVY